jgi:large subunit ribosomal protein L19
MLPRAFRGTARLFSTERLTYPFSSKIITPDPPYESPPESLCHGKGLMEHLHKTLPTPEKQELLATLFSHKHPDRIRPGSVLRVKMEHAPTSFAGVLLAVRRRGVDTSFVLRNIVQGTGVEVQFFANSPHLKDITVIRDHTGKRGGRSVRRAKLYYLRNSPVKMTAFASGVTE